MKIKGNFKNNNWMWKQGIKNDNVNENNCMVESGSWQNGLSFLKVSIHLYGEPQEYKSNKKLACIVGNINQNTQKHVKTHCIMLFHMWS